MSSIVANVNPFIFEKKSQRAKSGEYDDCGMITDHVSRHNNKELQIWNLHTHTPDLMSEVHIFDLIKVVR